MMKLLGLIFLLLIIETDSESAAKGSNLCTKLKLYEKDVIVPKTKLVKEVRHKFCANIPPVCSYDTWKTVSENVTVRLNHTRTVYECCKGYENHFGSCVPTCELGCGHGECIELDVCQCDAGWKAPLCRYECEPDTFGRGCTDNCTCLHGATCDKKDGFCYCAPGFVGKYCESPCPYNIYGVNCTQECKCQNDAYCDISDGKCECEPGYTGQYCEEKCRAGNHGVNCKDECLCLPDASDTCDHVTGECICKPGYIGDFCERQCYSFMFGEHCLYKCGCDILHTVYCEPTNGSCVCKPGWTGNNCSEPCPLGKFGEFCSYECAICPTTLATCNHETGFCDCPPGSFGDMCHESCPDDTWGSNCTEKCTCLEKEICNAITGKCICAEGDTEESCLEITTKTQQQTTECDLLHDGSNCTPKCDCSEEELCHLETGLCSKPTQSGSLDLPVNKAYLLILFVFLLLVSFVAGILWLMIHSGTMSLRKVFMRCFSRNTSSTSGAVSTDNIIGEGICNPMYECDDLGGAVRVSLEGPTYTRFPSVLNPEFPVQLISSPRVENSENRDAENDDKNASFRSNMKRAWMEMTTRLRNEDHGNELTDATAAKFDGETRSSILSDIRRLWSEKNGNQGNDDSGNELAEVKCEKFEEVAMDNLCSTEETKREIVVKDGNDQ